MILERIKSLCKGKNLSIRGLERETDIGRGTIASWDKVSPSVDNLCKVADYFGVSIDYLARGKTDGID